ncbi:MAG: hypothetical protein KJ737_13725 [Proteobacteria bacterium]|nr:hypothetical protein [Pseudomonadota bacterium]
MKTAKKDLQAAKKQLKALSAKIEKIEKAMGKAPAKKAAAKKTAKKKTAKKVVAKAAKPKKAVKKAQSDVTAIDTVVSLIKKSKNGIDIASIKKKTAFSDKQISNLLYKAKKKGVVKSLGKGVYGKA